MFRHFTNLPFEGGVSEASLPEFRHRVILRVFQKDSRPGSFLRRKHL